MAGKGKGKGNGKSGTHHAGGHAAAAAAPPRRRRRNPRVTFVQALMKVAGGVAAMVGSGVVTTYAVSKFPTSNAALYGIPVGVGLLGAAVATKYPVVGLGVAAGGASPFVLPIATKVITPASTTTTTSTATPATTAQALKAVAMGQGGYRELTRHMNAVAMGRVAMGRAA